VAVLATTAAADVTGVLACQRDGCPGVVPSSRPRSGKPRRSAAKIAAMREQLVRSLRRAVRARRLRRSLGNIGEAMGPYTRFVRAEQGKLAESQGWFRGIKKELNRLKMEVEEEK